MRCVAVVPARAGSKRVPGKNVRVLGGRPLVAYSLEVARRCDSIAWTVVSTDDAAVVRIASEFDVEVLARAPELGGDDVPLLPVVQDAVRRCTMGGECEGVVVLQPTNPFRSAEDVERAVAELAGHPECEAVLSLSPVREHPYRMRRLVEGVPVPLFTEAGMAAQWQELPEVYYFNGAVVAARREALLRQASFWGERLRAIVVDGRAGLDIDDEMDWRYAEAVVRGMGG
ncbi:acylneuraminate cytidylyltransferase family protein [bacterium]|nr:acylneuraminate cytidylyltransferase family protein [bacterium]